MPAPLKSVGFALSLSLALGVPLVMPLVCAHLAVAQTPTNQERKAEADRLLQQGTEQHQTGQYTIALQSWQQALTIYRQIKDRQGEGNALGNLGIAYSTLRDYAKAIEYQQQSLEIARQTKDRLEEGNSLGDLAVTYFTLGDYTKAIEYQQQHLVIARELKDYPREGQVLDNLSKIYFALEDYAKVIDYQQRSLEIARQTKNRLEEGNSLGDLGSAYFALGDYARAIDYQQRSLEIARELKDYMGEEQSLGKLGLTYNALGDYAKAIGYHQQSLAIAQQIKNRKGEGQSLGNLGCVYFALGDYAKAIDYHQRSLAIARQIKNRKGEGVSLGNLGIAYDALGDYAKAIDYQQRSLAIARQIKDRGGEGIALGNLGLAYFARRDYAKVIDYQRQSLAIARQIKDRSGEGTALGNLGLAYDALGDYARAIDYHQQRLAIAQQIKDRWGEGQSLGNLGNAYIGLKDYAKAIDYHQQRLAIAQQIKDRLGEGQSLGNLGIDYAVQQQPVFAISFLKQAVNVFEVIRQDNRSLPREQQESYTKTVERSYRALADLLLQNGRVMEALQVLDLLKVQELQDFFKDVKGNKRTAQGIEMFDQEQQILKPIATNPSLDLNNYLKSPAVNALVQQLRQTVKDQNLKMTAYTDLQTRLQNLGTNSALLYPLILDDRIELVLVTRNAPPIHRTTNIKQAELEQTIKSFLEAIQRRDSQDIKQPANRLYTWLIKPIEADLQQAKIQTLIYAPDGQMRYVPLAALYDGQHWLVEKYQINYVTALSLTKLDQRSTQPPRILAGAFTDKDSNVSIDGQHFVFGAIPFALPEVEDLNKQFPNATKLLTGKAFNRTAMTSDRINGYSIVHLATHGKLVSGAPEASFILLNNNEYITLREIKDWKLPNVALVVLSACQTALGDKLGNGIEVIGFGYQLQQAQARASIATLWEISDASTGSVMNEFYARLQSEHLSPVEALREAQIALITGKRQTSGSKPRSSVDWSSGQSQTATISRDLSHPYYWAPFILIGNGL